MVLSPITFYRINDCIENIASLTIFHWEHWSIYACTTEAGSVCVCVCKCVHVELLKRSSSSSTTLCQNV